MFIGPTFHSLCEDWIGSVSHRPAWTYETRRVLDRIVLPALGSRRARWISRRDIVGVLEGVGSPGVRLHALAVIRRTYSWGVETGRVDINPAQGIRANRPRPRERVLSLPELRAIYSASEDLGDYGRLVRVLILTGCRRGEPLLGTVKGDRPLGPRLEVPGSVYKTGRMFLTPLCPLAVELLGVPLGVRSGAWSREKRRLDRKVGLMEPSGLGSPSVPAFCLHDLRRSFATHAAELGLGDPDLIGLCLGHQRPGVRGIYNRSTRWPERVRLAARWSDVLLS